MGNSLKVVAFSHIYYRGGDTVACGTYYVEE